MPVYCLLQAVIDSNAARNRVRQRVAGLGGREVSDGIEKGKRNLT